MTESGNLLLPEFTYNRLSSYDLVSHRYAVIAGNGDLTSSGDEGPATDAGITVPYCLALDHNGDILFATQATLSVALMRGRA